MDYSTINADITFLTGQSTATYEATDRLRNINSHYRSVYSEILKYQTTSWENDDSNYTDFPISVQDSVIGQRDYSLPTDFVKLLRMEIKDAGGNYQKLQEFTDDQVQIGLTEFMETNGTPKYYKELFNAIELYPAFDAVRTDAIRLYYLRDISEFSVNDTTKQLGIPKMFARLVPLGASYDWYMAKGIACPLVEKEMAFIRDKMMSYYGRKNGEVRPRFQVKKRNYD